MREARVTDDGEDTGLRIVIDIIPQGPGIDPAEPSQAGFLAMASVTALPEEDIRAFDHHDTLAFATGTTTGEAGSAAATVIAAWLSEATLTTDRLWKIYGEHQGGESRSEIHDQ